MSRRTPETPEPNHVHESELKVPQNPVHSAAIAITASVQPPRNAIFHAKCGKWWTGLSTHHCSDCCRTFTSITAFDAHRDGSHAKGQRHCIHPIKAGLTLAGRAYRCWGWPGTNDHWNAEDEDADQ